MIEPKRSIRHEIKNTKHCPESKEKARLQVNKSFFKLVSEMERRIFSQIWNLQKKKGKIWFSKFNKIIPRTSVGAGPTQGWLMRLCWSRNHSECIPPISQMEQLRVNYFFKLGKSLCQFSKRPNSCFSSILEQVMLFQCAPSWFCCNNRAQELPLFHHCSVLQFSMFRAKLQIKLPAFPPSQQILTPKKEKKLVC